MRYVAHNRGFALIFSVVVVAVVTIVTLSISSLTRKSLDLTSSGIESQEAFYAADAGIECALYWDIARRADGYFRDVDPMNDHVTCFETTTTSYVSNPTYTCSAPICEHFIVDGLEAGFEIDIAGINTAIDSKGYNRPVGSTPTPTERGLRVQY